MKKKLIILGVFIFVLVSGYIGHKTNLLDNYRVGYSETGKKLIEQFKYSGNIIEITSDNNLNDDNMLTFKSVMYEKLENGFELNEERSSSDGFETFETYFLYDEDSEKHMAVFRVGKSEHTLYSMLVADDVLSFDEKLQNMDRKALLEQNNVKDDVDILKLVLNNYENNTNFFSSREDLEMDYFIKNIGNTLLPPAKIDFIDGDLRGYIYTINDNAVREVHLIHNEEDYFFSFINGEDEEYFDLDNIKNFLNKIKFID